MKREKEVMTKLQNPWMVKLKSAFQDEKYLYLSMVRKPSSPIYPSQDILNLLPGISAGRRLKGAVE